MDIEKGINERTYSQVTLKLSNTLVDELKQSEWFDTLGIKLDTSEASENECMVIFYAHGVGRNLFTKRLVTAIIHTFRSKL